ncbi:nitrilase-related carbon-nitrogen hydrolase [Paenibacillus durus]|uniref:nitrilase-related carbon-nitrogen hydrolase n=1 Tax=Paenibacillus durus TaxID=44251 RepID=UPI000693EC82|nr:nitrilase-related carbon-nitrogen hydrolase [Paenibacillus durus]
MKNGWKKMVGTMMAGCLAAATVIGAVDVINKPETVSAAQSNPFQNDKLVDTSPIKVAAVNAESVNYDLQAGLKKADIITKEAKRAGATLVAFPELWLPGFMNGSPNGLKGKQPKPFQKYVDNSIEVGSKEWKALLKIADVNNVYLAMSFSEKTKDKHLYMSQVLIDPNGKVIDKRSKINPSGDERNYFSDAPMKDNQNVVNTPLGRIGQLSCGEHQKPMMTFNMMAQAENIHIASWPYNSSKGIWWEKYHMDMTNSAYYAVNSGAWVIMPSVGRSAIINGLGEIMAEKDSKDGHFAIATIDRAPFKNVQFQNEWYSYNVLGLIEQNYKGTKEPKEPVETLNQPDYTKIK